MSTILRGYTSAKNISFLKSSELVIEVKAPKENRSGFVIDVADKDFQDFMGQVTATVEFLKAYYTQLDDLKNNMSDLLWEIDFGYNAKVATGELAVESLYLPLEFIKLCCELQIEICVSLYDGKLFE